MPDDVQIYADERWVRSGNCASHHEGWDTRDCFRFEYPDGRRLYADFLTEEQGQIFERQKAERLAAHKRTLERQAA